MATTTNYGWTTPNDTDLVKDGASAIRTLGQSIDTTFAELKGGTSGQMLTKASNTDLDLVWVTPEIGDITSVTATSPLTGGGTTGAVTVGIQAGSTTQTGALQLTDSTASTSTTTAATPNSVKTSYDLANAAIAKSTVTTAGDIIYRNATIPTRLAIGTAGQVLQVNAGATAPEWATPSSAGSMTSIASGSLSTATLTLNSISGSYKDLILVIRDVYVSSATSLKVRLNNDTASSYILTGTQTITTGGSNFLIGAKDTLMEISNTSLAAADNNNAARLEIYDYANSTSGKLVRAQTSFTSNANGFVTTELNGGYIPTTAITRIDFYVTAGSFSGGTYVLYGVN